MTYIRNSTANSGDAAQLLYGKTSQSSSSAATSASTVLQTAEKRISSEVVKTTTLLSSLGKLKSSIADTQSAARTLAGFSATTTAEDMKKGIAQLVSSFNATVASSKNVSATSSGAVEVPGAARSGQDMKRAINTDITLADSLRKWGVSVQSDGKLAFDTDKFDTRQKTDEDGAAVFQKLGQVIDKVSTRGLGSDGAVGRSMSLLSKRADSLKSQQSSLLDALQTKQSSQAETTTKTSATEESASAQQNSLFDILQADESDGSETNTSTSMRNSALAAYLSVSRGT